jgi:thiaminase/transcriptional activator TenA
VQDGSLAPAAFDAWLAQDAHFVGDLLWFQARLLARAPRAAQQTLAGGAVALVDELAWFAAQSAARSLPPHPPRLPATETYRTVLTRLDEAEPAVALTALWVIERVYLEAWTAAIPGAPAYRDLVAHWTAPEFAAYVSDLEGVADASWTDGEPPAETLRLVGDVLAAERDFWDMALAQQTSEAG